MRRIGTFTLSLLLTGWSVWHAPARSLAQTKPATTSASKNWPKLSELEQDVRALYQDLAGRTVRVIVPVQMSPNLLGEHPLSRWGPLIDPKIRDSWMAAAQNVASAPRVYVEVTRTPPQTGAVQVATQPRQAEQGRVPLPPPIATLNVEFVGLVLDEAGNVLVPLFIDKAMLQRPLQVSGEGGVTTTATVVGADRMTALSVIKLAQPYGKPIRFADAKPADGSIVMVLAPTRRGASLDVWPAAASESGVVIDSAAEVCGIIRNHHALFPVTLKPVVDQLITGGPVKRALLGVAIQEVPADHPMRAAMANLGARPAARVEAVLENSPAAKAGVRPGDLILQMDEHPVEDVATFAAAVANCGGKTTLQILRNGEPVTVSVELSAVKVQ